jgi:transcriptional regulator with XRE-family HTH domain
VDDLAQHEQRIDRRIGERIRTRRIALGLTQEQLASSLGVSYQQVQKYERGTNRISAARLVVLAQRLGLSAEHFLDGGPANAAALPLVDIPEQGGRQRAAIELARGFAAIDDPDVRLAVASVVRAVIERQA